VVVVVAIMVVGEMMAIEYMKMKKSTGKTRLQEFATKIISRITAFKMFLDE
jgi:hypothetical protein